MTLPGPPANVRRTRVVIIGAGPAGVTAAATLARHGVTPIVIDEAAKPGGQIYRQPPDGAARPPREIYGFDAAKATRIHGLFKDLQSAAKIDYRSQTLVWNITRNEQRFRLDLLHNGVQATLDADKMILATGAVDRALPFPGWVLPGVFTLGAAQIALKSQGVAIGRRVALIGAGPLLPLLVNQYLAVGIKPVAALDVAPFIAKLRAFGGLAAQPATLLKGAYYTARAAALGCAITSNVRSIRALGDSRVTGLAYATADGKTHEIACDGIAASFGLRSESQLADLAGCRFEFDNASRQWQPLRDRVGRSSVSGVYIAGDGAAIGGADVAELAGEQAALALLDDGGTPTSVERRHTLDRALRRQSRFRRALESAYPFPAHLVANIPDGLIICRCEGITAGQLRDSIARRHPTDVNRLKAFSRLGMGRCQGRMCGHVGAELLAAHAGCGIVEVGRLRAQPPIKPIPLTSALATEVSS